MLRNVVKLPVPGVKIALPVPVMKGQPGGALTAEGGKEGMEVEGAVGSRPGDESTIIICEAMPDGTKVFMFGLTRTVLPDGSVLYRFPSGNELGKSY